ncbi:MAG: amino acid ABC transporter permease [Acidimicrobiia bacterium]|nr:amino acid ABC transporter permease [Acidimicrobiia bacterium]MYC57885.1 amino acid ABC transporter permease [Acidimicrobiia bacterium]MYG93408.1 amino acid ABC transporter permease [Acidimicrobiia bacterium]MYI31164.1 amino acid ABC transporter permease [Acidimicrobiia bacterium]
MTATLPNYETNPQPSLPPNMKLSPIAWARKNLFNNWYNSLVTIIVVVVGAILVFYSGRYIFVTGQWEAVRKNLTLLMVGIFPRNEQWRLVVQMYLMASALGLAWGTATARSQDRAAETGIAAHRPTPLDLMRRYWTILLLLVVILALTQTIWPTLFTLSTLAVGLGVRSAAMRLPLSARQPCWYASAFMAILSFQVVSGTDGNAWWWTSALVSLAAFHLAGTKDFTKYLDSEIIRPFSRHKRLATAKDLIRFKQLTQIVSVIAAVIVVRIAYWLIGETSQVSWDNWSGLYLTLVASIAAITLSFPLALLLAVGRRSSLPVVRWLCVSYIELFRGVPFIALLFVAKIFIDFFLDVETPLSLMTRTIIAFTIFSSAYVAEVVRGGLQAVPKGQIEAGQALGLQPPGIMRLIVLPQALSAVIPAMVGQFISLFKDSSLFAIISVVEFYRARELIHSQQEFTTTAISETLVFVAFAYWALSYTMSKESQRLERHLGVGER